MNDYEYKLLDSQDVDCPSFLHAASRETLESYLTTLGGEGWELVSARYKNGIDRVEFTGVMKRVI